MVPITPDRDGGRRETACARLACEAAVAGPAEASSTRLSSPVLSRWLIVEGCAGWYYHLRMDFTLDREHVLAELQTHKELVALSVEHVKSIDRQLDQQWNVVFPGNASSWEDLLDPAADRAAVDRYWRAHDEVAESVSCGDRSAERRAMADLYEELAHPAVLGAVTSQRRHFILDSIAVACGLAKQLGLDRIVDVGCHAGVTTNIIAAELGTSVTGVDPSGRAIEYAKARAQSNVEFVVASVPFEPTDRFEFVISIDSVPDDNPSVPAFFKGLSDLLVPNGVALVVSRYWSSHVKEARRHLKSAGLGFGYADVVGGFGSIPLEFEVEGMLVLLKGGTRLVPADVCALMESDWHHFREYANTPSTPAREKTQAFERAYRRQRIATKRQS